jgi:hypothetical protein
LLQRSVTVKQLGALSIGGLSLSKRLYLHRASVQAEALGVIRSHAKGVIQARELALRLYDGYAPGDGIRRPLEGSAMGKLPRYLRDLAADHDARTDLARLIERGQAQAARVKSKALRASYVEALDSFAKGSGERALRRRLDVAVREKNRFFANRIAQTELGRAHQAQVAQEFMDDPLVEIVQVVINPAHQKTDICDMHARANLFGLGAGLYPKAKAPRPTFHPFCWCKLRSRPSLNGAVARPVPGGEAAYLRGLPDGEAARVMGSRARAEKVLNGERFDDVVNSGKDPMYRLARVGDAVRHPFLRDPIAGAFDVAKAGGKHRGFLAQLPSYGPRQRSKALRSFQEQIALHLDKIAYPVKYVSSWGALSDSHKAGILREWSREVTDHREQVEILKGYEDGRQ